MSDSLSAGLVRNTAWNFAGLGTPLLAAMVAIPIIIEHLGISRFGVLTLSWMVVGYFSVFDLGLGRALTQRVAQALGADQHSQIPEMVWTALALMCVLGLVGAGLALQLSPWIVADLLTIPDELEADALRSFLLLALSIPVVVISTGLRGVLEAFQLFRLVNLVRMPLGILNYLGPLLVLPYSSNVWPIVAVLVCLRCGSLLTYALLCLKHIPGLKNAIGISREQIRPLLNFGAWMTVSNIVGPLMVYIDRVIIASFVSVAALTFYATPQEMITRIGIIPSAVLGVLFPAFSAVYARDRSAINGYFRRAANYLLILMFPLVLVGVVFAHDILELWIGREFAENSARIMQILLLGMLFNSQARVLNTLIQSEGRADITAKVHLTEFVFYLSTLVLVVPEYGILGAAIVWSSRTLVDLACFALILYARAVLRPATLAPALLRIGAATCAVLLGSLLHTVQHKITFTLICALIYLCVALRYLHRDFAVRDGINP